MHTNFNPVPSISPSTKTLMSVRKICSCVKVSALTLRARLSAVAIPAMSWGLTPAPALVSCYGNHCSHSYVTIATSVLTMFCCQTWTSARWQICVVSSSAREMTCASIRRATTAASAHQEPTLLPRQLPMACVPVSAAPLSGCVVQVHEATVCALVSASLQAPLYRMSSWSTASWQPSPCSPL